MPYPLLPIMILLYEDLRPTGYIPLRKRPNNKTGDCKNCAVHNITAIASGIRKKRWRYHCNWRIAGEVREQLHPDKGSCGNPCWTGSGQCDQRLREEGIRGKCIPGSRGKHPFQRGYRKGDCPWGGLCLYCNRSTYGHGMPLVQELPYRKMQLGIATQITELVSRLNPDEGYKRLVNLVSDQRHRMQIRDDGWEWESIPLKV